jgi:hypothetical protein
VGRSSEQQERTANPAANAGSQKGYQHFPGHIQAVAIGAPAGGRACPQSERISSVGWNRRHPDEEESGKGQETASARHRVQGPADDAGGKEKDGVREGQG